MNSNHQNRNWKNRWADNPAEYLKLWRAKHGYSQRTLAEALQCSQRSVEAWEQKIDSPPYYLVFALKYLGE